MDSSHVLLALEEQKKWRERRKRIRERIRQLDRRRSVLRKELGGVRNKILEFGRVLLDRHMGTQPRTAVPPIVPGRGGGCPGPSASSGRWNGGGSANGGAS